MLKLFAKSSKSFGFTVSFSKWSQIRNSTTEKEVAEELHGIPEWVSNKGAYVFRSPVSSTQSGSGNAHSWKVKFSKQPKWNSTLMGWTASSDPVQQRNLNFKTKEEAITFCEKNGYTYEVEKEEHDNAGVDKSMNSYSNNFQYRPPKGEFEV